MNQRSLDLRLFLFGVVFVIASGWSLAEEPTVTVPAPTDATAKAADPKEETAPPSADGVTKTGQDETVQDEAGQEDLDTATDLRRDADNFDKLTVIIDRCESALKKGLGEYNSTFAKEMLAESYLDRAKQQVQGMLRERLGPAAMQRLQKKIVSDLELAAENNPKLGETFILLSQLYKGTDIDASLDAATKAITAFESEPEKLSEAYLLRSTLQDDNELRLSDLIKSTEINPKNRQAWLQHLLVLMTMNRFEDVYTTAKKCLEENENDTEAIAAAVEALVKLDRREEAITLLDEQIEKNPDAMPLRMGRITIMLDADRHDEAISDASKIIDKEPDNVQAYLLRANAKIQKAEFDKANFDAEIWSDARKDVDRAMDLKPNLAEGYRLRAVIASQQKKFDEAIQDLTILAKTNPQEPVWLLQLATLYQLDDRPGMAIKIADQLIRMQAAEARAYRIRGDAYLSMGDQTEAIEDFDRALQKLDSGDAQRSGLLNNLAWILATAPEDSLRDATRAIDLATEACELTEYKEAHILSTLAAGYAEKGDFEEAIKWSSKAVEIGSVENSEQVEQLKKELDSYREKKPWREKQEVKEKKQPVVNASEAVET